MCAFMCAERVRVFCFFCFFCLGGGGGGCAGVEFQDQGHESLGGN